jgi:hypothetical protein
VVLMWWDGNFWSLDPLQLSGTEALGFKLILCGVKISCRASASTLSKYV